MSFYTLDTLGDTNDRDLVILDTFVEGIRNLRYRVSMGERIGAEYPDRSVIPLSKNKNRRGVVVKPFIGNTVNMIAGTLALKQAVEACSDEDDIEYLPFSIIDHRKRVLASDLWIINPIGTFDCLDFEASDVEWDDERPDTIIGIDDHVLDARKLKNAPHLLRPDRDEQTYIVSQRLVDEMKARGVTNIRGKKLKLTHTNK